MPITINGTSGISGVDGSASSPAIQGTDTNTGISFPAADTVAVNTGGSERVRCDSSGRVGIGTTAFPASTPIQVKAVGAGAGGYAIVSANDENAGGIILNSSSDNSIRIEADPGNLRASSYVNLSVDGTERARIDSSGRLLVGTSTARSNIDSPWGNFTPSVQFESTNNGVNGLSIIANATDGYPGEIVLGCSRGSSAGSNTAVQSSQRVGQISFQGADGTNLIEAAEIKCEIDATPGTNDMPGRLVFSTTADGASSPTERMRIRSDGTISMGPSAGSGTAPNNATGSGYGAAWVTSVGTLDVAVSNVQVAIFNRAGSDGTIISLRQDATEEGSISVSGTTVSYNGAHLSRWSQLPSGTEREEILRGSVLSNLDEMCEWGEEDNEQLNRMKVSDVEGDKNVSGVFQAWDDDDDTYTNDFYCAMTGDFIIRIAADVTVERGDLLMSAGDGTAKPQGDGYVQDKTIAKVTSTHVSCTYDDGSYCVPCVLMAC